MKIFYIVVIFFSKTSGKILDNEKAEFCENLECDENEDKKVCGVRYEEDEVIFKLFDNECQLMLYGCQVDNNQTFGTISMKHCSEPPTDAGNFEHVDSTDVCPNCENEPENTVCGIRDYGEGFKVRTFENECQLKRHNCENGLNFTITDFFICSHDRKHEEIDDTGELYDEEVTEPPEEKKPKEVKKTKNLVVVHGSLADAQNFNRSISNFFAATRARRLRLKDMHPMLNETTRKMMIRIFGPLNLFTPWIQIPKNITEDYWHTPTLSSCFHKCPQKCPNTYAPVCGNPGIDVREPSLMFLNHCFMDAAQCKMYWRNYDDEYQDGGGTYVEASFVFCLGDELNGLSRFLPFIRTLQKLGRIKDKGYFRYKVKNMKWFNNHMELKQPRFNG